MLKCQTCNKSFKTINGLNGHQRMHGKSKGTLSQIYCCSILTKQIVNVNYLKVHDESYIQKQQSKINCKHCNNEFIPGYSSLFCSHSCSASYHNTKRVITKGRKKLFSCIKCNTKFLTSIRSNPAKTKCDLCKKPVKSINCNAQENIFCGPYSKIYIRKCYHCKDTFISRKKLKYCPEHKEFYSDSAKQGFKFKFNVYDYPNLFDLESLNQFGWFSPGGKYGKWNPSGLSRDHKVSVNESIRNNYDPFYITHPLNCDLIPHSINNKKKTKSSISYQDLISIVDEYENDKLARMGTIHRPNA